MGEGRAEKTYKVLENARSFLVLTYYIIRTCVYWGKRLSVELMECSLTQECKVAGEYFSSYASQAFRHVRHFCHLAIMRVYLHV